MIQQSCYGRTSPTQATELPHHKDMTSGLILLQIKSTSLAALMVVRLPPSVFRFRFALWEKAHVVNVGSLPKANGVSMKTWCVLSGTNCCMPTVTVEVFNDLHRYDTSTETWENLTSKADPDATSPSPRWGHGLITAGGRLFIFGGIDVDGMHSPSNIPRNIRVLS